MADQMLNDGNASRRLIYVYPSFSRQLGGNSG